eukprot:3540460-Ditylum_brightwellii.AAC.1
MPMAAHPMIPATSWQLSMLACINWEELLDKAKERLCIPIQYCGCGLRQLRDRNYSEYLGGIWHGLPPLLDSADEEGNHVPGRLNVPVIVNLIGQHSFGSPEPWE